MKVNQFGKSNDEPGHWVTSTTQSFQGRLFTSIKQMNYWVWEMRHWAVHYCLLGNILTLLKIKLGWHLSVFFFTSLDKKVMKVILFFGKGTDNTQSRGVRFTHYILYTNILILSRIGDIKFTWKIEKPGYSHPCNIVQVSHCLHWCRHALWLLDIQPFCHFCTDIRWT